MFKDVKIVEALVRERKKVRSKEDALIGEVNKILKDELYTEKNILQNLQTYNETFDFLQEKDLDKNKIFGLTEIKNICIQYNLRFLDSQSFKGDFPSEALYAIKELRGKEKFKKFKVLGTIKSFKSQNITVEPMLFAETNYGNYFLVHQWGQKVTWHKKISSFPMRGIETLLGTIICISLFLSLTLPNNLLIYNNAFPYWDMHRIAVFFHFIILFSGLTIYVVFAFHKKFSSSAWDDEKI